MAEAYAMVTLIEQGWADQLEVARAFGCSTRTVRRMQGRFNEGGLPALGRGPGFPKGLRRARAGRQRRVHDLKTKGLSNRAIAVRLGVTENAVRKLVRRLGWKAPEVRQAELPLMGAHPNLSASAAPSTPPATPEAGKEAGKTALAAPTTQPVGLLQAAVAAHPNLSAFGEDELLPVSFDSDPADRRIDRLFAHLGCFAPVDSACRVAQRLRGCRLGGPLLLQ